MLSLFLTLSNTRQPEAPLSAVGDTVCPLGILKIYLPCFHGSNQTQAPAWVQGRSYDSWDSRRLEEDGLGPAVVEGAPVRACPGEEAAGRCQPLPSVTLRTPSLCPPG